MSTNQADLFPPPSSTLVKGLEGVAALLRQVLPLRPKHMAALPGAIRALSGYLTDERDQLPPDYMNQPPLLSAYLHYFLPWNLYRQGRLLEGLDLRIRPGSLVVDQGAGPLTFLLALWLARPAMRTQDLNYLGLDRSESVLKHGRQLFRLLDGASPWQVRTERKAAGVGRTPRADVLVLANFLNELDWAAETTTRNQADDEAPATPHDLLLERWERQVAPEAAILLIEPGMRASGRNLVRLRETALARGWQVAAPCPHAARCPMPGQRNTAWCHFNFVPEGAPQWLERLSQKAKLPKDRASLSFLLLTRGENPPVKVAGPGAAGPDEQWVRVVSESFDLPEWQRGRYGCSGQGLVLLQDPKSGPAAAGPRPGDLLLAQWPEKPERDHKSGAWILARRG
jgi:ribosomal protein RSM22 (predicted rRNA methylase)